MTEQAALSQERLQADAYADDHHLNVRYQTHQCYTVDPVDFGRWTLERLAAQAAWRGDEWVLDVGCARGELLRAMANHSQGRGRLVGCDLSPGMIAQALEQGPGPVVHLFLSDVQALPLPDETFDVVMARHMLYHVPDIAHAIAEAARVLRPGGRFLATTNSANTMPEYWAICARAAERYPAMASRENLNERFSLENGDAYVQACFDRVAVHTLPGTLRFPSAEPFVDYFASTRTLIMNPGHTDAEWQAVVDFVGAEAESIVVSEGCLDVTKVTGAILGIKGP
jgi:SAM-dependent methyltransferase